MFIVHKKLYFEIYARTKKKDSLSHYVIYSSMMYIYGMRTEKRNEHFELVNELCLALFDII